LGGRPQYSISLTVVYSRGIKLNQGGCKFGDTPVYFYTGCDFHADRSAFKPKILWLQLIDTSIGSSSTPLRL